jgi:hypothetical protein
MMTTAISFHVAAIEHHINLYLFPAPLPEFEKHHINLDVFTIPLLEFEHRQRALHLGAESISMHSEWQLVMICMQRM